MEVDFTCDAYETTDRFNTYYPANSSSDFSVFHLNIRSLRKNVTNFQALISSVDHCFDILCLSETFLYSSEHNYFPIPGYSFIGNSRDTRQGGVGLYVRSGIEVEEVPVSLEGAEAVSVRLVGAGVSSLQLTCVYRRPSADQRQFIDSLERFLSPLRYQKHLIVGDINIDILKPDSDFYTDIHQLYNYQNILNIPTRVSPSSSTCIDHILCNFDDFRINSGTLQTAISDHYGIFAVFENSTNPARVGAKCFRNLKFNENDIQKVFSTVEWTEVFNSNDVVHAYEIFLLLCTKILDRVAPLITLRPKSRSKTKFFAPWFTPSLDKAATKRDMLAKKAREFPFSPVHTNRYKKQRNRVCALLREAKANYYNDLLSKTTDPRKLWNIINLSTGRKNPGQQKNSCPKEISTGSGQVSNPQEVLNELNNFFTTIGPKLANELPESLSEGAETISPYNDDEKFQLSEVDSFMVLDELCRIDPKKSTGPDNLPAKFVKFSAPFLYEPLTHIINLSMKTGTIPKTMKLARVTPLFKNKGSRKICGSYRPISILPIFSKILEKIVNLQLKSYLANNCLISLDQYGFQEGKGTTQALLQFTQKAFNAMHNSETILGIFIDFQKAFDTINHKILFKKMERSFHFSNSALTWFKSYLSDRSQYVSCEEHSSSTLPITCGVPQGSTLGPTLFLMYINDLTEVCSIFSPILFADDTNLFFHKKRPHLSIEALNNELGIISKWCISNKLTINLDKTNFTVLKNHQNRYQFNESLYIQNTLIPKTDSITFLGVSIDTKLHWGDHISNLKSSLRKSLGLIYAASSFLPTPILIMLYNCLINSKLTYCIEAWGNAHFTNLEKIHVIQKKILRIIFKGSFNEHSVPFFQKANILPIQQLYIQKIAILAHNSYYTCHSKNDNDQRLRRSKFDLPVPKFLTERGQRSPDYQIASIWNSLPDTVRAVGRVGTFRVTLKRHLLDSLE